MTIKEILMNKLADKFPQVDFNYVEYRGDLSISLDKKNLVEVCTFLKEDNELAFNLCEDVTAIDWARRKNRFTAVYHIFSMSNRFRLRLKADIDEEDPTIDSISSVWSTADWHERETFDMYGIHYNNHPDHRRMYMPEEFEYHPLRKDFPLMGIPGSLPLPKK